MSIQVKNLTHIYSKGMPDEQLALDNVSFEIADGEKVAVIGHTGSGKSTLMQHLNGIIKPSSGSIIIGDTDITDPKTVMKDVRRRVGLVFQYPEYQLFEETVSLRGHLLSFREDRREGLLSQVLLRWSQKF